MMAAKMRRPNEPTRPPVISAEEIEAAPPHKLEEALAAHEGWADRLLAADDPGRGLPPAEAAAARQQHLRELETQTEMAARLRSHWEATAPEKQQEAVWWQRIQNKARRQAAAAATSPEEQARLDAAHDRLAKAERDRKAREKIARHKERLHNPPSPDAPELIGAVLMQPELLDALEHKLRQDSDGTWYATHQLTVEELGVLVTVLHLLRELGSVEIAGMSTSARWPRREPPLVAPDNLKTALLQLRRQRLLSFTVVGDVAVVTYGDRIRELAKKWGLVLP
jgi:hypothetical protein